MRDRLLFTCLVLVLGVAIESWGLLGSQASPPITKESSWEKGVVFKGKAPINKAPLKIRQPASEEIVLKNGLRVLLIENHKVPILIMQMFVLSGGLSDPDDHRGLASFTASLLREGTIKRPGKLIAEQMETLGMTWSAESAMAAFTSKISATGLVKYQNEILDLFAEIICSPSFPHAEIEKFKARSVAQRQAQRASPSFLIREGINRAIYGGHPAGIISAPVGALMRTTSEDLRRFHSRYYRPNNAILAITGDVTLQQIRPKLESVFADWKPKDMPATLIPPAPPQRQASVYVIDRPGSVQTTFQIGNLAVERVHPDYIPLLVMNKILGGGPNSRLSINLREEKGYTYGLYSFFEDAKFRGLWSVHGAFRTEVTESALREILYEFKRIRNERAPRQEIEDAKRALIGDFAVALQDPEAVLQNFITQKIYQLPTDYWQTYPQKIETVTAGDVRRVAREYLDLVHQAVVLVGDASKIKTAAQRYGPVHVYGAESTMEISESNGNGTQTKGTRKRESK